MIYRVIAAFTAAFLFVSGAQAKDVPSTAKRMYFQQVKEVRLQFGLSGPVALHGAQIHQESMWRPKAESPVGARGLAQFMPATADWMPEVDKRLADVDSLDPRWALRAQASYNKWLYDRVDSASECDRWAFVLSAYNGGLGWVYRDKRLADDNLRWWGSVKEVSDRADWAFEENREYVEKILFRWQPMYLEAGFAGPEICEER